MKKMFNEDEVVATKPIDPMVAEYLKQKMAQDGFQQAAQQNREMQSGLAGAQFASSIGDALAGRSNSGTQAAFQNMRNQAQDATLGDYARQRQFAAQDLENKRESDDNDPNSQKSINFRSQVEAMMPGIAKAYGPKWSTVTAADQANIFSLQKLQDSQNEAKMRYQGQRQDRQVAAAEKQSEREYALKTPYGPANSIDDAKQLKSAHESKQNFDSKLNELIALRQEYGGELFNREAVGRGKQLSKDLLLEYKNMAKLGVLSQSDENIINAIIPADPLAFSMAPGQDPIMHQLKKFKEDSDKDFSTRVSTRTRDNVQIKPAQPSSSKPKWAK